MADVIDNDMKLLVNWGDGTDEEEITLADDDDTINVVTNGFSNIGAIKGQIVHKYTTIPSTYYTVTMTVMDKDNTPQATTTFYVRVVPAPVLTVSTVGEIPSTDVICEESDKAFLTPISVKISAMIPYDVNVKLTVEDVNNSGGTLALSSSNVVIKANSLESGKVFITPKDGTEAMPGSQFKIKASIDQTQYESADVYDEVSKIVTGEPVDCVFWVANVPPVAIITSPAGTSAESPLELALNTDVKFEQENIASLMRMAVNYGRKIGFKGDFYIEPKPKEPMKHQYDFDAATAIGFLKAHGLDKDFKMNIEANHATLAQHTFQHELCQLSAVGVLFIGSQSFAFDPGGGAQVAASTLEEGAVNAKLFGNSERI